MYAACDRVSTRSELGLNLLNKSFVIRIFEHRLDSGQLLFNAKSHHRMQRDSGRWFEPVVDELKRLIIKSYPVYYRDEHSSALFVKFGLRFTAIIISKKLRRLGYSRKLVYISTYV